MNDISKIRIIMDENRQELLNWEAGRCAITATGSYFIFSNVHAEIFSFQLNTACIQELQKLQLRLSVTNIQTFVFLLQSITLLQDPVTFSKIISSHARILSTKMLMNSFPKFLNFWLSAG